MTKTTVLESLKKKKTYRRLNLKTRSLFPLTEKNPDSEIDILFICEFLGH